MSQAILGFSSKSVPDIIERVRFIVTKMTGNIFFVTPNPDLADVTDKVDAVDTLYQQALGRDKTLKALLRLGKKELLVMMETLKAYVQTTSEGDMEQILSAGFGIRAANIPLGILPAPGNLRIVFGVHPGELILLWAGVHGRTGYLVQMSTDPTKPELWEELENGRTGKVRFVVTGLEQGKVYWFRVFTVCTAGISAASAAAGHIAI